MVCLVAQPATTAAAVSPPGHMLQGQYSFAGLAVMQQQSEAAYALVQQAWQRLATAAGGGL